MSRHHKFRPEPLTKKQLKEYVLPIGIATALEIGFSNVALKLLSVSFGTILKGGAPVFTMLWGLLLSVEKFSPNVCMSLFTIAIGIALASFGEEEKTFNLLGFILQLLATALGGLRWAMTHVLLKGGDGEKMPPLTATLYTSPMTAACVLPFAVLLEGGNVITRLNEIERSEFWIILGTMTLVGSLVFVLLISEYWLVNATSSLALSVAGVFKELLTIAGGIVLLREHLTVLNVIGFLVCQVGIFIYVWLRYNRSDEGEDNGERHAELELPLTQGDISDGVGSADGEIESIEEEKLKVHVGR